MGNAIHRVMSKKRTATQSSNDDEQKNEDSDAFQQVVSDKRGKFDSSSDKTLHDLPLEMLECILVKAIVMEVKGMKLSKSVWKEKADLVINRMRSVCPYWNNIITTNFFRNELHRALDAQKAIHSEILHQSLIQCHVISVTTLKDDVLLFCLSTGQDARYVDEIRVYDRNNIMAGVKEVIPFTEIRPALVAACNVSNCIYVLEQHIDPMWCSSVFRFTRDEARKWKIQTWITDLPFSVSSMSVSDKGNLIIKESAIKIYGPNGLLLHEITLSPDINGLGYAESAILQKSNGNLALVFSDPFEMVLVEIDTTGIIARKYQSSLNDESGVNFADISGRILLIDPKNGIELLDSEFNLLDFTGPQPNQNGFNILNSLHYNSERNEIMAVYTSDYQTSALAIFHFVDE